MLDEKEYYRSVLDNLTGGFLGFDLDGKVVYANPTALRILRIPDGEPVAGKSYERALAAYPPLHAVIKDALATHKTVHRAEVSILHADTPMTIGYSTLQVRNPKGEYLGIGIIFQNITLAPRRS